MSGKNVQCPSCGCSYVVYAATEARAHCPGCGQGPEDSEALRSSGLALPSPQIVKPYWPLWVGLGTGVTLALSLYVMVWYFTRRERTRPEMVQAPRVRQVESPISSGTPPAARPAPKAVVETSLPPLLPSPPPAPERPALPPEGPPLEAPLRRINRAIARDNLAAIVATVFRYSGRMKEYHETLALVTAGEREIRELLQALPGPGTSEDALPRYLPGDQVLGLGQAGLDPTEPEAFSRALSEWVRRFQDGDLIAVKIARGGRAMTLPMYFPERTPELEALARRLGPAPGASPAPPAEPRLVPFPPELRSEIDRRMGSLHPYYRSQFPAADRERLDGLLLAGKGKPEDLDFLRTRILGDLCRRAESDYAAITSRLADVEPRARSASSPATVVRKDGTTLSGTLEEQSEDYVRIRLRYGAQKVPRSEIDRVVPGDPGPAEFKTRYAAAKGQLSALVSLLPWCEARKLSLQKELVALAVLALDPGHEKAWEALGLSRDSSRALGVPRTLDRDIVHLKDGTSKSGLIAAETEPSLTLEVPVQDAKGAIIGAGRLTIPRESIAKIDRLSPEAREKAVESLRSFEKRLERQETALARIAVTPTAVGAATVLRTAGRHFELFSTCEESFVRESTMYLEEIFEAYQKFFAIRRNSDRRIQIYLLANRSEYDLFQLSTQGVVLENPAYFDPRVNAIVAYNGIQRAEAAQVRLAIHKAEQEIQDYKRKAQAEEERMDRYVRTLKREITDSAQQARLRTKVEDGRANLAIDRKKEDQFAQLRKAEGQIQSDLRAYRKDCDLAIAKLEQVILENNNILAAQSRRMYETLFHEAFHAFASNYLWTAVDNAEIPRWLHEGMATYFERSAIDMGEILPGAPHPVLQRILKEALKVEPQLPIEEILRADGSTFSVEHRGDAYRSDLAYATSWLIVHYLSPKLTPEKIEAYVKDVASGKDRVTAFETLAGLRLPFVQRDLKAYVEALH